MLARTYGAERRRASAARCSQRAGLCERKGKATRASVSPTRVASLELVSGAARHPVRWLPIPLPAQPRYTNIRAMPIEPYLPAVTALLTLANTIVLFFMTHQTRSIRRHVNGMQLQLLADAEERGRRRGQHQGDSVRLGE